jgi:hypothetical protein
MINRFKRLPFLQFPVILIFTLIIFGSLSCRKKDKIDSNPGLMLNFSTDTVFFDTVFTSVGSVTKRLLVYNSNNNKLMISSVSVAGGSNSNFAINVDGAPGPTVRDIEIPAHDSIFIFVRVTVDPNNHNTPLIITDSILFMTNTNLQNVKLVAWGQDAHFYKNTLLKGISIWDSIKPQVIYGHVRVDTNSKLTIMEGTKIYVHKHSSLNVLLNATLVVDGKIDHPVRFQGDRLDAFYKDLPGQWDGILIKQGSTGNVINYAIIKNGVVGISVDSVGFSAQPTLKIDNTIIQNVTSFGLYCYAARVKSTNCVIGDCGSSSLALIYGGKYDFRQLTIGNYWSSSVRTSPALYINNYITDTLGHKHPYPLDSAFFGNVIVYGNQDEEITLDSVSSVAFNHLFDHCLLKTSMKTNNPNYFIQCLVNKDPGYVNPQAFNYQLDSISAAIQKGVPMGVDYDIKGVFRGSAPDLGAYQYVPK